MRLLNHWKLKRLAQRENLKQLLPSPLATQATCRTLLGRGSLFTGTAFGVNLFACPDTPDVVQQEPAFM